MFDLYIEHLSNFFLPKSSLQPTEYEYQVQPENYHSELE